MKLIQWLKRIFFKKNPKDDIHEEKNVVASIAKAKALHKKLLVLSHPDRHLDKQELATELSALVNENRYNYEVLVSLESRIREELT